MKKYVLATIVCICIACTEEPITVNNLITELNVSPEEVYADTKTKIKVTAILNSELDKRNVIFKTSGSVFSENKENKVTVEATFLDSILSASTWIEPLSNPTEISVSAQIEIADLEDVYIKSSKIDIVKSEVEGISLTINSFSVPNNFGGEIEIVGTLKNNYGNGVSQGYVVKIEDYNSEFEELQGHFRNSNLLSNSISEVSTIYSPGVVEANQFIYLIATVLDENLEETSIQDTVKLYITEKE